MPQRAALVYSMILPVLVACALSLWRLESESIWHDEAWSIRAIDSPFGTPDDNTPFLYYASLHLLQRIGAGDTPFALRYGSVLVHLVTVALGVRLAGRWFGLDLGLLAGLLLALSPLLWEYSQEVRAYVAVPLLALLLLGGVEALLNSRPTIAARLWAGVWLTQLAALYTHNLSVPLIVWANGIVLIVWGSRYWQGDKATVKRMAIWLGEQVTLLLLYLPWLLTQSPSGTGLNTVPQFGRQLSQELWRGYVFPVVVNSDDLPRQMILLAHVLPVWVAFALLFVLWRGRNLRSLLLFSQMTGLPILSTLLLQRASIDFHPRYYILAVPASLVFIVAGLATLPQWPRWAGSLLLASSAVYLCFYSLNLIAQNRQYQHDDFAELAAYYAQLPADSLIIIPFDDEPALQDYFAQQLPILAPMVNLPLHSSLADSLAQLNQWLAEFTPQQVEVLTWYQLPADERGMLECLLGSASQEQGRMTTYGLQSQHFIGVAPLALTEIEWPAQVSGPLSLTALGYQSGPMGACIASEWRKQADSSDPFQQVAAQWLNPFGWPLAQQDRAVLDDRQEPSSRWGVGESGWAFTFLEAPMGLPAQAHRVTLRLYSPGQPNGWDALALDGSQILGKEVRLSLPLTSRPSDPLTVATLQRDNAREGTLEASQRLLVEWLGPALQGDTLTLSGSDWEVTIPLPDAPKGYQWAELRLPPDAEGEARLSISGQEMARYQVQAVERLWQAPPMPLALQVELGGLALLAGVGVEQGAERLEVTLLWQALTETDTDYQVFVQLLDSDGRLLTQSDGQPSQNTRPTSGWLQAEYLLDSHSLNLNSVDYRGKATLIVGLYDPATAQRLTTASGSDLIRLPLEINLP
jgi:hypothetical protein